MSRETFSHLNRDGTPKVRLTRGAAEARCVGEPHLRAYHCPTCKGWHVGRTHGKIRQPPTEWIRAWERVRQELEITT